MALAVDRASFSKAITETIENDPRITIHREEIRDLEDKTLTIVATGPLTSDSLSAEIARLTQGKYLYFYDAISPIVYADSIDMSVAFTGSRYGKGNEEGGEGDYLNLGLDETQYYQFVEDLLVGEKIPLREFERAIYFEGCLPLEEMAARGKDTLAFGPMKPVGLEHPKTGETYCAVAQLRTRGFDGRLFLHGGFFRPGCAIRSKNVFSRRSPLSRMPVFCATEACTETPTSMRRA